MRADRGTVPYVLGHSDQELARLETQAEIFGVETKEVLRRAGLKPGMRVLDVGCGVGDVAMAAAEMVGPTGSVLGIDRAQEALPAARARAAHAGYTWLRFADAELQTFAPDEKFDALVGRFILMHVADPVAILSRLTRFLTPGAAVAFIELDIGQAGAVPKLPLLGQCIDWITTTYRRVGVEPNMGSRLYATFRAVGLRPHLTGTTRIESGSESIAYDFTAQTLQSLLPAIEKHRIATAEEIGLDTLASRLRDEAVASDHCIMMPRLIGAWATTN